MVLGCILILILFLNAPRLPGCMLMLTNGLNVYQCSLITCQYQTNALVFYKINRYWYVRSQIKALLPVLNRVIFLEDHCAVCPTALNDQIEVYYKLDRPLNGLLSLWVGHTAQWSSMKIPLIQKKITFCFGTPVIYWTIFLKMRNGVKLQS